MCLRGRSSSWVLGMQLYKQIRSFIHPALEWMTPCCQLEQLCMQVWQCNICKMSSKRSHTRPPAPIKAALSCDIVTRRPSELHCVARPCIVTAAYELGAILTCAFCMPCSWLNAHFAVFEAKNVVVHHSYGVDVCLIVAIHGAQTKQQ